MRRSLTMLLVVTLLITCKVTLAQQPAPKSDESHKYRTIFTLAGGGGGFALGLFAGLAAFDDATNSDRKVWTTAALSAVGGAVGGYFLGRALDKRKKSTDMTEAAEDFYRGLMGYQWPSGGGDAISNALPSPNSQTMPARLPTESGWVRQTDPSAMHCDLSRIYLAAALQKMEFSE